MKSTLLFFLFLAFISFLDAQETVLLFDFESDSMFSPAIGTGLITVLPPVVTDSTSGNPAGRALDTTGYPLLTVGNETAGVQVTSPTIGFTNIRVSWENRFTATASNRLRLQYTLDGTLWQNFDANEQNAINKVGNVSQGFDGGLYRASVIGTWHDRSADFSQIVGADDNPHFAIRFVTAFPFGHSQYHPVSNATAYAHTGRIRYDNITYRQHISTPLYSHDGGIYFAPISLTLYTATAGASIYYTVDGSIPTVENGSLYDSHIDISSDTTLRFFATKDGLDDSDIITLFYRFATDVACISELRAIQPGTQALYRLTGEAIVTYSSLAGSWCIQDTFAGIMIYDDETVVTFDYTPGDLIQNIVGTLIHADGSLRLVPAADIPEPLSTGNAVVPRVVSIADLEANFEQYLYRVVRVYNAFFVPPGTQTLFDFLTTYSIFDDTGEFFFGCIHPNADYLGTSIPVYPTHIIGIVLSAGDTAYLSARDISDIDEQIPLPPQNLTARLIQRDVNLSWDAPDTASPVGYFLYRDYVKIHADTLYVTQYIDEFLAFAEYVYHVTAVYPQGIESQPSNRVHVDVCVLNPPTDPSATFIDTAVRVEWGTPLPDEHLGDLLSYHVYRDGNRLVSSLASLSYHDTMIASYTTYTYFVTAQYVQGESLPSKSITLTTGDVSVQDVAVMHDHQIYNYPNPFNPTTTIVFSVIGSRSEVSVTIYNTKGQKVRSLFDASLGSGEYRLHWDGVDDNHQSLSTGIYFLNVKIDNENHVQKMVLIK